MTCAFKQRLSIVSKKLEVGMLVVCVQCWAIPHLVGAVGEITEHVLWHPNGEWATNFPQMKHVPCACGAIHDSCIYVMEPHEIKPLEDPDGAVSSSTIEELEHEH